MGVSATAPGEADALPRRFGRYVLFDKIGEGGMARIFLAREKAGLGGDRLIVVKEILPLLAASGEMSQLLVEEAKLCASLTHRNVVQVTDLGREDGRLYIAMEYVEGLDLREVLRGCSKKKLPLPVEFSLFIVAETLRALDYAHRKRDESGRPLGIVHRDVSPSNVLLSVEGEVKLCDFGIARVLTTQDVLPEEAVQGKAGYMSPEAARGDAVDGRSDVFAAGIVLWELLAGARLYRSGAGRASTLEQAREANIPPLPTRGFPDEARLQGIVMRALERDPARRWQSAAEMLEALETYVTDNRIVTSALRFGDWLVEHFGAELVELRRERERAARHLDEVSGPREATVSRPGAEMRRELPTLPDPEAGRQLPVGAYRDSTHDRPTPLSVAPAGVPRGPSRVVITVVLVFVCALAGGLVSLYFGQK